MRRSSSSSSAAAAAAAAVSNRGADISKASFTVTVTARSTWRIAAFLILVLLKTTVNTVVAVSSTSLPLPQFAFKMLINDTNVDFYVLRNHITHATDDHLSKVIASQIGKAFQGLHLESTIQRTQQRDSTLDTKVVVESIFRGSAVFWESTESPIDQNMLHTIVAKAFVDNSYWSLMHLFVEDPILKVVDTLEVVIDTSILNNNNDENNNNNKSVDANKEKAAVSVLAIFSVIFLGSTSFLLFLAYRRYYGIHAVTPCRACLSLIRGNLSLSSFPKRSDSTDDEDDRDSDDHFKDENIPPPQPHTLPPQTKKSKKNRRVKPSTNITTKMIDMEGAHLDSIVEDEEDEDDEENLADVPLDNLILI